MSPCDENPQDVLPLQIPHMSHTALAVVFMLSVTSLVLIHLITESLHLWTPFPRPPPLVSTSLISFSMSLVGCLIFRFYTEVNVRIRLSLKLTF